MHLYIKNMVCDRCIMVVRHELEKLNIDSCNLGLGEVEIQSEVSTEQIQQLATNIAALGFELIDNHTAGMIEKIKTLVLKKARNEVEEKYSRVKLSNYLSEKLHHEYTYLSSLFSSVEGRTIENYFIEQRIEKAKELLVYGEMNLSEIAYHLDYSSVAHLSAQFKKVTGLTPSYFKEMGTGLRRPLDMI
jgi:AraC family transcriptional regulator